MLVVSGRNVNDLFLAGLALLKLHGAYEPSRAGRVLVCPQPVTSVYYRPQERVLFHSSRDANPFFHLGEALWMLSGSRDARWLDQFVKDFSSRFAEEDGLQHGAYGWRWRAHFDMEAGGESVVDQLDEVVRLLRANPADRRIVLTMWDPVADLGADKKDVPCNTQAYFRVIGGALEMMVSCRSNDAIWGAYGANAVHFSVLQEYLAARAGLRVGTYYQVSWNFHAYVNVLDKLDLNHEPDPYQFQAVTVRLVDDPETFDEDLNVFMRGAAQHVYNNRVFTEFAIPMRLAYAHWRAGERKEAWEAVALMPANSDWRLACESWMGRRMTSKNGVTT